MLNVFEISRMTNHNGPGIRTLVHFKGCALRCQWCSTPESQKREPELGYKAARCIGCFACVSACPNGALAPSDSSGSPLRIDRGSCVGCFACVKECYSHALVRIGSEYTVDALLKEIRKDELFFRNSGGGVTFSGGEPLLYVDDEMTELYRRVKEAGISIGVDTCGAVDWANIERVLPYVDFFLWDLKFMDAETHKRFTGADNRLILENLRKLDRRAADFGTDIYIRCVQIPGMTDTDENLIETCALLRGLTRIREIDLVNYHQFGKKRYEYLQREYPLGEESPLPREELERKKALVERHGVPCVISM